MDQILYWRAKCLKDIIGTIDNYGILEGRFDESTVIMLNFLNGTELWVFI